MRKGTFSVQTANPNSAKHNSRELAPKYLIGLEPDTKNYYELLKKDDDFILEAQAIYKEKIKQTMQKKQVENIIQETVLTLQPNQDEKNVKDLFKKLNKKYGGHELLEVSIHRDEGHFEKGGIAYYPTKNILNKNGDWYVCSDNSIKKPKTEDFDKKVDISTYKKVYNYHAHAKFSMFDKELGKSARMQKKDMSERIKFVSDELGLIFAPGENSRVKKSVNQIKDEHLAFARAKENIIQRANEHIKNNTVPLAKMENLNVEIEKLRKELIASKSATKEDYNKLKEEKEILKEEVKNKTLTIEELQEKIQKLTSAVESKDIKIQELRATNMELTTNAVNQMSQGQEVKLLKKENEELKARVQQLEQQKAAADRQANMYLGLSEEKNIEVSNLHKEINTLKSKIKHLEDTKEVNPSNGMEKDIKSVSRADMEVAELTQEQKELYAYAEDLAERKLQEVGRIKSIDEILAEDEEINRKEREAESNLYLN